MGRYTGPLNVRREDKGRLCGRGRVDIGYITEKDIVLRTIIETM